MKLFKAAVAAVLFFSMQFVFASEADNGRAQTPIEASFTCPVPRYSFPYGNGLYASIAGFLSVGKVKVPGEETYKLSVDGFAEPMPVEAVIQDHAAPLVIMLPGIGGKANSDFTKLWPSWLAEAGYHVLWFDSTFLPRFSEISKQGVSGNVWAETSRVKRIISTFLALPQLQGNVTRIGVVGMSYGGTEALMLGELAQKGQLPFKLDAVQAYSPPIRMRNTAELFDQWYNDYRWNYTLVELATEVGKHKPTCCGGEPPFSDEMMKAAMAAVFHEELTEVVIANDRIYGLNLLPHGNIQDDEFVRRDYAETWGFMKYAYDMGFPYWQEKLHLTSLDQLIDAADLTKLLANQPPCSQTIVAVNDPLDVPEDMEQLKSFAAANRGEVILLPRGGHVGFVNNCWTKAKLMSLFSCAAGQATQTSQPDAYK